jgi:hypothetical protein
MHFIILKTFFMTLNVNKEKKTVKPYSTFQTLAIQDNWPGYMAGQETVVRLVTASGQYNFHYLSMEHSWTIIMRLLCKYAASDINW